MRRKGRKEYYGWPKKLTKGKRKIAQQLGNLYKYSNLLKNIYRRRLDRLKAVETKNRKHEWMKPNEEEAEEGKEDESVIFWIHVFSSSVGG